MATKTIDVPEELLALLQRSRLGRSAEADRVKAALAIHLSWIDQLDHASP